MPSADLDAAASVAVKARVINNGQSCIAAKRFIAHESIADAFEQKFVATMKKLKIGDPLDPSTDVGPLAMEQIVDDIHAQVRSSISAGARLLLGGKRIDRRGYFYEPTVLTNIPTSAPAYADE